MLRIAFLSLLLILISLLATPKADALVLGAIRSTNYIVASNKGAFRDDWLLLVMNRSYFLFLDGEMVLSGTSASAIFSDDEIRFTATGNDDVFIDDFILIEFKIGRCVPLAFKTLVVLYK